MMSCKVKLVFCHSFDLFIHLLHQNRFLRFPTFTPLSFSETTEGNKAFDTRMNESAAIALPTWLKLVHLA